MNLNLISLINAGLAMLSGYGDVGKYAGIALGFVLGVGPIISALVAIWHGIVALVKGLSGVPGLGSLAKLADTLKADQDALDAKTNLILAWTAQLSSIQLPVAKK